MRLFLLLIVAGVVTLGVPGVGGVGTAEAQVWKIKKKPGAKTAAKRPSKPTRTARPSVKKKRARKQPKVELVPEDDDDATSDAAADKPREDEEPIFIQVEEISD